MDSLGLITSLGPLGTTTLALTSGTLGASVTVNVVPRLTPQAVDTVIGSPYAAAISPAGVVYVVTLMGTLEPATLASFDFTTVVQGLGNPRVVAFSPSGNEAYVAGSPNGGLTFIDVASNTMTGQMAGLPGTPFDIAVAPNGIVYLSTEAVIYAIDPVSETVIDQLTTGSAGHLALHPSQPLLYLSAFQVGRVYEISTTTLDIVQTFNGGGNPIQDLTVSPDGTTLYVTDEGSGTVQIINLATGAESFIPAGCAGWSLLLNQAGTELYVGCNQRGAVNLLDLASGSITGTVRISRPRHMAISSDGLSVVIPGQDGEVILLQ